ncbi:MAG: thioredoxin family protein [Desulfotomaculaceae bacterium]|nr:thioredoxin family protein [Desulfotomaculaceae bacterium]MDD4766397.1 thioredoxin family protein [Desulfotomaculaceae bacterium]
MEIKILSSGCWRSKDLAKRVEEVVAGLDRDIQVDIVEDMEEILKFNILRTPGLVVEGKLLSSGKVPSKSQIKKWIQDLPAE